MGNFLKKITTTTLLFIAAALIGQSVSLNSGANRAEAAGKQVIYDFDSATATGFTTAQPKKKPTGWWRIKTIQPKPSPIILVNMGNHPSK